MKTRISAKATDIFRNKKAILMYNKISNYSNVYEYGVDNNGHIYFAYLNGIVERYTRREFLELSKEEFQ